MSRVLEPLSTAPPVQGPKQGGVTWSGFHHTIGKSFSFVLCADWVEIRGRVKCGLQETVHTDEAWYEL